MTSSTSHSVLCSAALASGLALAAADRRCCCRASRSERGRGTHAGANHRRDPRPAACRLGYLNRWQVEQLKEGRTKFKLGPYRIVNAIGQGGMGHVFKAEHKLLGRIEAIKVLPKSKSTPEAVAAFQREIRAQAQLDHPNLVRVSYADYEGDTYFFVTEYVPGTDLRKLVRRNGPLPYPIAATIISQAAEGLHYAHRRGLVHRDVKPGNLLVTPDGRTKMTDLGLAWFLMEELEGGDSRLAKANSLVGTADYLAPETIRQPDKILPVSDVYSLGCTLYYAVTGKVPFPGGNTADKIRRHLDEMPLNPLHFNPDLPTGFLRRDRGDDGQESGQAHADGGGGGGIAAAMARRERDEDTWRKRIRRLGNFLPRRRAGGASLRRRSMKRRRSCSTIWISLPGQVESPSQISQGTVSVASELEDTLAGVPAPRRPPVVATGAATRCGCGSRRDEV